MFRRYTALASELYVRSTDHSVSPDRELTPDFILDIANSTQIPSSQTITKSDFIYTTDNNIKTELYYKKYYGKDKEQFSKYKNRFISALSLSLFNKRSGIDHSFCDTIESQFCDFCHKIRGKKTIFENIVSMLLNQIEKELLQNPVLTKKFPSYIPPPDSDLNDERILNEILEKNEEINNNNQKNQSIRIFTLSELNQFYEILSKHSKPFSFSPQFVKSALEKFDDFLNALKSRANDNSHFSFNYFRKLDTKSEEFQIFIMILLIKMRLFMIQNQIHDFLIVLLQIIIIDQETNFDDLQFKSIINEIIPKYSTRRSTIVKNVSFDQIFDFSFSSDEKNDYILTKEGVFKVKSKSNQPFEFKSPETMTPIKFNSEDENKIQQFLNQNDSKSFKITFSNGILYLLCFEEKIIYRVSVSPDEELTKKAEKRKQKLERAKEYAEKKHPKKKITVEVKSEMEKKEKLKVIKMTQKKLREKEKKEKREKRKMERYENDEIEIDLKNIQFDVPNYPVLSFGVFNNFVRIIQRKSTEDNKTTLILTSIDLSPNDRINYKFADAFNIKTEQEFNQKQFEIEIENEFKIKEVLLSGDSILISFENSSFQQYFIYENGISDLLNQFNSPFTFDSNSIQKMDNNSFLYNLIPIKNDNITGISISQMNLLETKHFLRENNGFFLKYPFLQGLSNLVDNCSQFIINRNPIHQYTFNDFLFDIGKSHSLKKNKPNFSTSLVSPGEISALIQSYNTIVPQLENIKSLIKDIKDESLQQFFITLFIKLTGVNSMYEFNKSLFKSKLETNTINNLKKYKSFILDLYSLLPSSLPRENDIIIRESMIFILSITGKFLFYPDSYQELRDLMNQILKNDEITKTILKSFSTFIFSYIHSLYFIDQSFYEKLMELKHEINIYNLFKKNILYVMVEVAYTSKIKNFEFIQMISPYFQVFFQHIRYIMTNESKMSPIVKNILAYILCFNSSNIYLSLILEKELIETSKILYELIRKTPGVIENDIDFLAKNQDLPKIDFQKEIRVIESKHPYNSKPVPVPYIEPIKNKWIIKKIKAFKGIKKSYKEDLGTVDFGTNADSIYIHIDNKSKLAKKDLIIIKSNIETKILQINDDAFNNYINIPANKVRISIARNIKDSQEVKDELWGCKLILTGVKSNDSYLWKPHPYLILYSYFIALLTEVYSITNNSTKLEDSENDFDIILSNNIIQGIKLEDIDNYEKDYLKNNQNDNKSIIKPGISKGVSRGLNFDSQNKSEMDIRLKKDFIKSIITVKKDNPNPAQRLLDALYTKTAKKNIIKLNQSTEQILEAEHYFAACLFKQLGLISTCIKFLQVINNTKKEQYANIEFPSDLLSIWRYIYSLRKTLFFEYQKSKSIKNTQNENDNSQTLSKYEQLIKMVNQKCKLLLFSAPILQFIDKENFDNDSYSSAAKSILSFVTSKMPLSDISRLIDIRNKRLSISSQSISLLQSFLDQNVLFESSKPIFAFFYSATNPMNNCLGVKQSEIENYQQQLGKLTLKITQNIFSQPSISMISQQTFLANSFTLLTKCESTCDIIKILKDMIDRNKSNNSFYRIDINYILIHLLIVIAFQTEEIIQSSYFNNKQTYETPIKQREINENILIASFYSFLANIMQIAHNAGYLMNEKNLKRTLSIFELSMKPIPTKNNSIQTLSSMICDALAYSEKKEYFYNGSFKFIKINYGEIVYSNNGGNDLIKSYKNHLNMFLCNHPFNSQCEVYYEVQIKKIGDKNIFIGFINSNENITIEKAFGFGASSYNNVFCRKSPLIGYKFSQVCDEIMKQDQIYESLKEGDNIGCYYTPDYCYLTVNGNLTPYRISTKSMNSYIPIIIIDHDQVELEIIKNVTIIDHSNSPILNVSDEFFDGKDIKIINKQKDIKKCRKLNDKSIPNLFIGQKVFFSNFLLKDSDIESIDSYPKEVLNSINKNGYLKDIIPLKDNPFVSKCIVELYNTKTTEKSLIEVDSRYILSKPISFLSLIENSTKAHFGINQVLDSIPEKLQNSPDLGAIDQYLKNKIIKDCSLSTAIIMLRYLSFILIDYLRYSKSTLLQDEGINSKESSLMIKALAYSLPTITQFNPSFDFIIDKRKLHEYLIFSDEQDSDETLNERDTTNNSIYTQYRNITQEHLYKIPGDSFLFDLAFKIFLKKSDSFISPQFLLMLLKESYAITKDNILKTSDIYDLIPPTARFESISPLPDVYDDYFHFSSLYDSYNDSIGFIPILVSSIPDQLPCVVCLDKRFRLSSDRISYFTKSNANLLQQNRWKYNIEKLKKNDMNKSFDPIKYKDYKLKCGLFYVMSDLNEVILRSPLGFIQTVFIIFQVLIDSEFLYEKQKDILCTEILNDILSLSLKNDPLTYPFISPLIISIISMEGYSDYLMTQKVNESLYHLTKYSNNLLYKIENLPNSNNESNLIFSILSTLIQLQNRENTSQDISTLFNKYFSINHELFKILTGKEKSKFVEGSDVKTLSQHHKYNSPKITKKKNYQSIYLLYYYSILLNNESHLPYPKFLFIHDWMRQHFGSFQTIITMGDIEKYEKNEQDEIQYKSTVFYNEVDLECTCQLFNIFTKEKNKMNDSYSVVYSNIEIPLYDSNDFGFFSNNFIVPHRDINDFKEKKDTKEDNQNSFTLYIHQLNNDERIELPQNGESIHVSFPLEIIIHQKGDNKKKLLSGESFIINFSSSEEQEKKYFIEHFDELQEDFDQFISLGKYDTELSKIALKTKETIVNNNNNNDNNNTENDNLNTENIEPFSYRLYGRLQQNNLKANRNDFKFFELEKIPKEIKAQLPFSSLGFKQSVISLRYSILNTYNNLIESTIVGYTDQNQSNMFSTFLRRIDVQPWCVPLSSKNNLQNLYMKQIIRPAFSMNTESKFKLINQIFMSEPKGNPKLSIVFNRFEQQKFMEKFENNQTDKKSENKVKNNPRPLIIQFIEQVDEHSLQFMKVRGGNPFRVNLVGENAIDAGGPGREIFSSLIMEMMNEHIGIFDYNPNRKHANKYTNQEDLIPNKNFSKHFNTNLSDTINYHHMKSLRFIYVGALIAVCIVSNLPQPMNLAYFIWEYLSNEKVSIESIYDIDENFKKIIQNAEDIQNRINSISDEEFESLFNRDFTLRDSFDNVVDLIPSGSKIRVKKENIKEFIELAKNYRIHEFDNELKQLKKGFDIIMCYKNITSILHPYELKQLACGEQNCDVEQMKKLFVFRINNNNTSSIDQGKVDKFVKIFWDVIESFTPEERMEFIKFSSGNIGLPAPGLKWEKDIEVNITTDIKLLKAHTCFSSVDVPLVESQEELAKALRISIKFGGLITDSYENPEAVAEFL